MKQEGDEAALVPYLRAPGRMRRMKMRKRREGPLGGNCAGRLLPLVEHRGEDERSPQPPGSNPPAPFCGKMTCDPINCGNAVL